MERETQLESAFKFGAGRVHFSHGAASLLGDEAQRLHARSAMIIAGNTAFSVAGDRVLASLHQAGIDTHVSLYSGQCTMEQANLFADEAKRLSADLIVGVGGGRIMDLSKAAARAAGLPVITVPTLSATSAPYTHMSVMYTPDGHWVGTWFFPSEVSAVLADMDFLAAQPKRFIASGAVDAMAKWMEVCHPRYDVRPSGDTLLAQTIAKQTFDRLALLTPIVCRAEKPEEEDLWEVCFLSIAGASLVSGTARCLRQSAIAHAFYEWTRRFRAEEVKNALHGEIVGVGMRAQGAYNEDAATLNTLESTLTALHMPVTLADLGLKSSDAGEAAAWIAENMNFIPQNKRGALQKAFEHAAK